MNKALKDAGEYILSSLALFAHLLVSAVVFLFFVSEDVWQKVRRELIILVFGYGGDVAEAVSSGVRAFFDPDYARGILNC